MKTRTEKDALGRFQVPADAYYGIFTARALKNFQLTGQRAPREYIRSLGIIKQACTEVNFDLGLMEKKSAKAIIQAACEFAEGKFDDQFPLDVIQAGAGTPFNMNANEVIANRANELLGKPLGSYDPIHPNNHVNMSQSSNDVTPTAIRLAALFNFASLIPSLEKLIHSLKQFSQKYSRLIKVGRTHLEDAVPITLGQEFRAYSTMLEKTKKRIMSHAGELCEIGLGGTALGTGITTHPLFQKKVVAKLAKLTKFHIAPKVAPTLASLGRGINGLASLRLGLAEDLFETTSSMDVFLGLSAALRRLAVDFIKIANDLKLLNMGPLAGIAEITLPEVEPGSSIMPGKVNPSIPEAAHMAAYDMMASDNAIALAAQAGQLELNVMTPLILKHLLGALSLSTNTCEMLRVHCIEGITVNENTIRKLFENSLVTATALAPYLGYHVTAELVKEALAANKSIVYMLRQKGFLSEDDIARILSPERTTKPAIIDMTLKKKIEGNEAFRKYSKLVE